MPNINFLPLEIIQDIISLLNIKDFICFCLSTKKNYIQFYNSNFIKFYLKVKKQSLWSFIYYSRNNKVLFDLIMNCFKSQNTQLLKNDNRIIYTTFTNIYKYNPDILVFLSCYGYNNISLIYFFISKKEYYLGYIFYQYYNSRIYKHFICIILLIQEDYKDYYKEKLYYELYNKLTGFEKYLIDSLNKKKYKLLN